MSDSRPTFPSKANSADYLGTTDFFKAFNDYIGKTRRRIFKLERLQEYQEPDNPSFRAFQEGKYKRSLDLIRESRKSDSGLYLDLCQRGVEFVRVRATELPLTEYLKWEFSTYQITARYGERILVCDLSECSTDSSLLNTTDFLLFDSFAVLIHDYDDSGILRGGWLVSREEEVKEFEIVADHYVKASVPLAVFEEKMPDELRLGP